jgi:hypothetical protein
MTTLQRLVIHLGIERASGRRSDSRTVDEFLCAEIDALRGEMLAKPADSSTSNEAGDADDDAQAARHAAMLFNEYGSGARFDPAELASLLCRLADRSRPMPAPAPAPAAEEFRAGLPAEALRAVCQEWDLDCGYTYVFDGDTYRGTHWTSPVEKISDHPKILRTSKFRPHHQSWSAVEIEAAKRLGSEDATAGRLRKDVTDLRALIPGAGAQEKFAYDSAYESAKEPA